MSSPHQFSTDIFTSASAFRFHTCTTTTLLLSRQPQQQRPFKANDKQQRPTPTELPFYAAPNSNRRTISEQRLRPRRRLRPQSNSYGRTNSEQRHRPRGRLRPQQPRQITTSNEESTEASPTTTRLPQQLQRPKPTESPLYATSNANVQRQRPTTTSDNTNAHSNANDHTGQRRRQQRPTTSANTTTN